MYAKRLVILVVAALGGAACSGEIDGDDAPADSDATPSSDAPGASGEPPDLAGTTAEHNRIRAEVGVGPLTWDPQLAAIAQAWVSQCRDTQAPTGLIDHNPDRGATYPTSVGENVYGASGQGATGVSATRSWEAEKANFTYPTTCASGRVCGHYTQIVWRASTKLGCAVGDCPGLTYRSSVVCNYAPAGNSGGPPY